MTVQTIDCHYCDTPEGAAAYLMLEGDEAAFVETNTVHAWPHLLAALTAAGRTVDDVRYVFVTHAHLDHAGGAWHVLEQCPNAVLVAHPRAAVHLIDPSKLVKSATGVYGAERFAALYGELRPIPAERVRIVADGETVRWGQRELHVLHTRGHANHHYVLHDPVTKGIFTGDAFGIGYPVVQSGGAWVFPSTSPTDFDGVAAIDSVRRIVATGAELAYLTHFGPVGDLSAKADALIADLEVFTAWVEAADRGGLEGEPLDAHFQGLVASHFDDALKARGLGEAERSMVALDVDLNAQGLSFAVAKARYKRARG